MMKPIFELRNITRDYCRPGLILPMFHEGEWYRPVRGFIYLIALLYFFVGVSVVTEVFMAAVIHITTQTKKIYLSKPKKKKKGSYGSFGNKFSEKPEMIEVRIWNETVANLTLMALGSSAPEVLLTCIEVIGHHFEAGQLGPNAVVGSAAYNLLMITAVCMISIPTGEVRRIRMFKVSVLCTTFSIMAYVWLFFVITISTPQIVELWEAIVTFLLFPTLAIVSYIVDKGWCDIKPIDKRNKKQMELSLIKKEKDTGLHNRKQFFKDGKLTKKNFVAFVREIKKLPGFREEETPLLAAAKVADAQPHPSIYYRIGAVRDMTAGRKLTPHLTMKQQEVYDAIKEQENPKTAVIPGGESQSYALVEFHSATCGVRENVGTFPVTIWRHGNIYPVVKVRVQSLDGSAKSIKHFLPVDEVVTFQSGEQEKKIMIDIVDKGGWGSDEESFFKLSLVDVDDLVQLGKTTVIEIKIINEENPGIISFKKRGILVKESAGGVELDILRRSGSDGDVSVYWRTIDGTAINGKDFMGGKGEIQFGHLEVRQILSIPIIDDFQADRSDHFEVEISAISGGARIGYINKVAVTITNDDGFNNVMDKMLEITNKKVNALAIHRVKWIDQMKDALSVNGGDIANATFLDYILHLVSFNWKVMASLIPPPTIWGGWLCFTVSLAGIGVVTAFIGDIASIFGCVVGLPDSLTAITFVAIGTSLPDTFASRVAAMKEKHADNSIGNIMGSNSVNVFLGLGLPWLMATTYHTIQGNEFVVPSGSLGFSVLLFTVAAMFAITLMLIRRNMRVFGNAELGGPSASRYFSAGVLVLLWAIYLGLICLHEYRFIDVPF